MAILVHKQQKVQLMKLVMKSRDLGEEEVEDEVKTVQENMKW